MVTVYISGTRLYILGVVAIVAEAAELVHW